MLTHSTLFKPVLWGKYKIPSKIYMRSWPACSLLYGNQCSPIPDLLCTMTQRARNLKTRHIYSRLLAGFLFTFHQWEVKIDLWADGSVRFSEASCTSLRHCKSLGSALEAAESSSTSFLLYLYFRDFSKPVIVLQPLLPVFSIAL